MAYKDLAPIVLFVYNRPEHTETTLEALADNELASDSILYIYADGLKAGGNSEDIKNVALTREIIRKRQWCKQVNIIESSKNKGLANSIVDGVTTIVNKYGKVIVLEDDILTAKGFLSYMNNALSTFENEEQIMHISAYMYPVNRTYEPGVCFLKILSCWGWATWKRAWHNYSDDLEGFMLKLTSDESINKFNILGNGPFYDQLHGNFMGTIKTWAVRWYASWYFKGGYSLFPKTTLVKNIGHDGSGIHCGDTNIYDDSLIAEKVEISKYNEVVEDLNYKTLIDTFYANERAEAIRVSQINIKQPTLQGRLRGKFNLTVAKFSQYLLNKYIVFIKNDNLFSLKPRVIVSSSIGMNVNIVAPCEIQHCTIKDYTYVAKNSHIQFARIGKFCSIGPNLMCGFGIHPLHGISTSPMFYSTRKQNGISLTDADKIIELKPINIGNDVFIGMNVTILDGISIGDGAVIGAGTVVTKNVPPYTIAVGAPMRFIKKRFTDEQIEKLLQIEWWNFSQEDLKSIERDFFDIDAFIAKHSNNL